MLRHVSPPKTPYMTVRLAKSPDGGWATILLDSREHDDALVRTLEALAELPGFRVYVGEQGQVKVEIPHTLYRHADVISFCDGLGVVLPTYGGRVPKKTREVREAIAGLYRHQIQAVRWLLANRGGLLGDDMGLGKTRTAAVAAQLFRTLQGEKKRPIIVLGPPFAENVWRRELAALGAIPDMAAMRKVKTTKSRTSNISGDPECPWIYIPYQLAHAWMGYFAVPASMRPCAVILDEVHWVKNARANRTRGAVGIATLAPFRVALSGTPVENRVGELWRPLSIVCGEGTWGSQFDFRKRYCGLAFDGYGYRDTGSTNIEELEARLQPYFLRRTKETAGIYLPPFRRELHYVDPGEDLRDQLVAALDGYTPEYVLDLIAAGQAGPETLKLMTALRKVGAEAKLLETVALADECLAQGQSVIVFVWLKETAEKLARALRSHKHTNVFVHHGGVDTIAREAAISWFQAHGGAFIATIDSVKEGVTLHRAERVIVHDLPWSPSTVVQAEARAHRIGQTKPVLSTWMVTQGSLDPMIAGLLAQKSRTIDGLFKDERMSVISMGSDLEELAGTDYRKAVREMFDGWV